MSAQIPSSQTFPLPNSHVWEAKARHTCRSAGSVGIRQAKESPETSQYFSVEAGRSDSRLEVTIGTKEVKISLDGAEPEEYRIVANTTGVLSAVWVDETDAGISSISIDKLTSYVILSTTDPRDWKHDVPRLSAMLFSCSPATK